ncbi:MAG: histidine phosphatase family protein [Chthoniobacterales bacterium]
MRLSKSFSPLLLGFCLLASSTLLATPKPSSKQDQLIFAIDLIRHGDRNPIVALSTVPHQWPEGLGQLTPLGMHQEYELGKKYRHRYIDQVKLLPKSYQAGTLYVRSTDIDRTLMSAECFLMGLYPPGSGPRIGASLFSRAALPGRFQPIPIHTAPKDHDPLLLPKIEEAIKENVLSSAEWRKKRELLKPYFASWSQATGFPIKSERDIGPLGDALFIHQLKHIPFPKNLSQKEAAKIIDQQKDALKKKFNTPAIGRAAGGPLLRDIAHYLTEAAVANNASVQRPQTSSKPTLRYVLYSAHDSTILALMSAMHVPLDTPPHYASDVNISLFSRPDHSAYVRFLYNEKPVLLPCSDTDGRCSLKAFLKLALLTQEKK